MYKHNAQRLFLSQDWAACLLLDYEIRGTVPLFQAASAKHWQLYQPMLYTGTQTSTTPVLLPYQSDIFLDSEVEIRPGKATLNS